LLFPFLCSYEIARSALLVSLTRGLTILPICEKLSPLGDAVTR